MTDLRPFLDVDVATIDPVLLNYCDLLRCNMHSSHHKIKQFRIHCTVETRDVCSKTTLSDVSGLWGTPGTFQRLLLIDHCSTLRQ